MQAEGYSSILIILFLGLGIPLAITRPYRAFLLALVVALAGNAAKFNQTRLPGFGPLLNMSDACLLIMLLAVFFDRIASKRPVRIPPVAGLLILVSTIGAMQSFWKLGWTYETIRAYRWTLDLPIGLLLGANLVTNSRRAGLMIGALLAGSILSAGQHLLFAANLWRSMALTMENYALMRTIAYGGMSSIFLMAAAIWRLPRDPIKRILCLFAGMLFLGSIFLSQTRSAWVPMLATIPCLMVLFGDRHGPTRMLKLALVFGVVIVAFTVVLQRVMPGLDPAKVALERFEVLKSDNPQFEINTGTRKRDFDVEMRYWMEGTLIFGRGLFFYQTIFNPETGPGHVAFGHLGYVTYLAQLGLVGLFVYGFFLPFSVVRDGYRLWRFAATPSVQYLALFGTASIVCASIGFLMSSSFLGSGVAPAGVLYGSIWVMARRARNDLCSEALGVAELPAGPMKGALCPA